MSRLTLGAALVTLLASGPCLAALKASTVLAPTPVATANASVFATPLAVFDGAVYTVNIEPGSQPVVLHGLGLKTVLRRGARDADGHWRWSQYLVDDQTANDPYHTAASVGIDRDGYIHVAYNMHNLPWQYAVSKQPGSIDGFVFRGDRVSIADKWDSQHRDVEFPAPGRAAIPGTQVTYPAFFNDRNGTLYVTYRYAARPARDFGQRQYSGGLAAYDEATRQWHAIGGDLVIEGADAELPGGQTRAVTRPLISEPGWWVYQIRLAFDADNGMHLAWYWRKNSSGVNQDHASYAYAPPGSTDFQSADGQQLDLPIGLAAAGRVGDDRLASLAPDGFYSPARITVSRDGHPVLNLQSINGPRFTLFLDRRQWSKPAPTPGQAWELHYDDAGHEWAFVSGLTVLRRAVHANGTPRSNWTTVFEGDRTSHGNLCHPRAVRGADDAQGRPTFYIHGNVINDVGRCENDRIAIVWLAEK
ncbi:BNR-4 repeat-containing protein [Salinisphaera sp. SPP-AMP-43]|uniref:BNR-4 repeat-containing protein n=1 Tax=Salinisphaera sp. SPP-AMP-43 TaxID=3121288 RepID=UPI003C6E3765